MGVARKAAAKRSASAISRRNRQRGQEFEREVSALIRAVCGVSAKRRLGQERESGHDIDADIPWTGEAKRVKRLGGLGKWMGQAERASAATGHPPVIFTRADAGPMYAILRAEDFLRLVRESLERELL